MKILVYTTSQCPNCKVLKVKLTERGIPFEELNAEVDEHRLNLYMVGRCTVPTLVVDGRVIDDVEKWLNEIKCEVD